mmetsp:Transcript_11109/g.23542  ORF Transcript_11109/g.23542 Transcript_11109/m.23542 type:complete len:276 (+) Transcript_11109:508-1335(+)
MPPLQGRARRRGRGVCPLGGRLSVGIYQDPHDPLGNGPHWVPPGRGRAGPPQALEGGREEPSLPFQDLSRGPVSLCEGQDQRNGRGGDRRFVAGLYGPVGLSNVFVAGGSRTTTTSTTGRRKQCIPPHGSRQRGSTTSTGAKIAVPPQGNTGRILRAGIPGFPGREGPRPLVLLGAPKDPRRRNRRRGPRTDPGNPIHADPAHLRPTAAVYEIVCEPPRERPNGWIHLLPLPDGDAGRCRSGHGDFFGGPARGKLPAPDAQLAKGDGRRLVLRAL